MLHNKTKNLDYMYKFTLFLIISTIIHNTPPIPFGRQLNAAKLYGKGKLVNILRNMRYFVGLSLVISL